MKQTLIALLTAFTAAGLHAAAYGSIPNRSSWANSTIEYEADTKADGAVVFTGCDEGQDLAFRLTPKAGSAEEYLVTGENPDGCVNPFAESTRAKRLRTEEYSLICLYDDQGRLRDVLSQMGEQGAMREADWIKTCQLLGDYTSGRGEPLSIEDREIMQFCGNYISYLKFVFNSLITNVIEIKGDQRLNGFWDVRVVPEGLRLQKVVPDGEFYGFFTPAGQEEVFIWARKDVPRFKFASEGLLSGDQLRGIDNATLRLMRNEIWFHHGYVPSSEDLRQYLEGKEWYTPRESNDGIYDELNLVEKLNIELIKTRETLNEIERQEREAVAARVAEVYDYIESVRRYYLDTPPSEIVEGKWAPVDELFATRGWRKLRSQVEDIDRNKPDGGFFNFDGKGPLDPWVYDCFEGKVTPGNLEIFVFGDGTATVNFQIRDAVSTTPVDICWMMRMEDGEWRVDDISFMSGDSIELGIAMENYLARNRRSPDGSSADFDFEKYRGEMVAMAEASLNYRKSPDDIRLTSYALIDVDSDGVPEVWVRGDEGQDYQGVYAVDADDSVYLLQNSDARSELHFFPGAVCSRGYYGDGEFREFFITVEKSFPAERCYKYLQTNNFSEDMEVLEEDCYVNGEPVSKAKYDAFISRLGEPYEPAVEWHTVKALPN